MGILGTILYWALQLFVYAMFARFIVDFIMSVNRGWRPPAILMPVVDFAFTITDLPLKFVRRFVRPVRLGVVALDLAWTIVLIAALFLQRLVVSL
ncbi:MAG: YggT family protein [Actinomycetota bacterium]|nr:YggT family protein [Actinomycetota bacterium]